MIVNDQELSATLERIRHLQTQVTHLRKAETNPAHYHLSASGFLAEIDRMQLEVREYLSLHPGELKAVLELARRHGEWRLANFSLQRPARSPCR